MTREKEYDTLGRNHSEFEAMEIDDRIIEYMQKNKIHYNLIAGTAYAHQEIYDWVFDNG